MEERKKFDVEFKQTAKGSFDKYGVYFLKVIRSSNLGVENGK